MPSDNTLNVFLVRHGETEANKNGMAQGQTDSPLTEEGVASTLRKAGKLAGEAIDAIYSSDLQRAVVTAKLLKESLRFSKPVNFSPDLREIDFGELSGKPRDEIMPIVLKHKADTSLRYPGGESGRDLMERTRRFFDHLKSGETIGSVLVVTHYGVMETAARLYTDIPPGEPVVISPDDVWLIKGLRGGPVELSVM